MMRHVAPMCGLLVLVSLAPPALAAGERPHSTLYEPVENMLIQDGQRRASASLWGTAKVGTPFCPTALLEALGMPRAKRCTVTAFGGDDVNLVTGQGTVWAHIGTVVNPDNPVDPAEALVQTGTITGELQVVPWNFVKPDFGANKKVLGPVAPFILIKNGQFRPDAVPVLPDLGVRTPTSTCQPPVCFAFSATFRLPFALGRYGEPERPEPGKPFFYLADDGSLIRIKNNELLTGLPLPRAEVQFTGVAAAGGGGDDD